MNDKVLTLLGFAAKAGKLSYGFDAVRTQVFKGKSKIVLVANDISPKSQKEILFYCNKFKTRVVVLKNYDITTISHAMGHKCGIVSVNDSSFAEGLMSAINIGRNLNDKQI